jgi:hypothetical protein
MNVAAILSGVPEGLREPLLNAYAEIMRNYRERRWEPSELNGGKLCEVVYSILRGHVDGRMPSRPQKPRNMVDSCRALENADASRFPRSIRVQIPRMLVALYEIRNNRGVGHVGGDVDPNEMDSKVVVEMAKWIMAELVRAFHNLTTDEATEVVETIVERTIPVVWLVDGRRRVLQLGLSKKDEALLLLYSSSGGVSEAELLNWVEHSNPTVFRRDVLKKAHRERLIEYNAVTGTVRISPTGIAYVEKHLPLQIGGVKAA